MCTGFKCRITRGVRGELSLTVDVCNSCDSTTQEADLIYFIWETLLVERILVHQLGIKSG